ncbi:hypothetical protein QBC46DRAFT_413548 [Diplogelasinospora grovesii]|uniref:Uncharacterized protein n=1 Tax=Diplogelasinospora grovesii TaxID=303347 RepID=A0AAN6MZS4_9PEZI|nr:hypothetical protein QBC46DRAFT_413548 [Diplogelasinospora grovesii]
MPSGMMSLLASRSASRRDFCLQVTEHDTPWPAWWVRQLYHMPTAPTRAHLGFIDPVKGLEKCELYTCYPEEKKVVDLADNAAGAGTGSGSGTNDGGKKQERQQLFVFEGLLVKQIPHVVQRVMHQDLVVSFMTLVSQPFEVLYLTEAGMCTRGPCTGEGEGCGGLCEVCTGTDKQGRLWRPALEYQIIYCRGIMEAFADSPLGRVLREEMDTGDKGDMMQVTFSHEWIEDLWFIPETDDMSRVLGERRGLEREGPICGVWEVDGEFDSVYDYGYEQGEGRGWRHEIRNCKEQAALVLELVPEGYVVAEGGDIICLMRAVLQRWEWRRPDAPLTSLETVMGEQMHTVYLSWMLRRGVQAVIDAGPDLEDIPPACECECHHDDDDEGGDGDEGGDKGEEEREGKGGEGSGGNGSGSSDTPSAGPIAPKNTAKKTGDVKNKSGAQEEDAERGRQSEQEEKSLVDDALAGLMKIGWAVLADASYQGEKSSSSSDTPVAGSIAPKASRVACVPESGEPSSEMKEGNVGQKENAEQEEDAETGKQSEEEEKSLVANALVRLMKIGWAYLASTPDAVDLD